MYLEYRLQILERSEICWWSSRVHPSMRAKRIFDVVVSLLILLLALPLGVLIALLIKWCSPGPIFYVQRRVGYRQELFSMLKFRSMHVQAHRKLRDLAATHSQGGPFIKIQDDPRIFGLGRLLRKYSLDELPQLFNVLKGDMSLVGPRPIMEEELEQFEEWVQLRRFSMRPGMTGLWQVSGRSDTDSCRRVQLDLSYVADWSLLLDSKILFKTVPTVIRAEGAI